MTVSAKDERKKKKMNHKKKKGRRKGGKDILLTLLFSTRREETPERMKAMGWPSLDFHFCSSVATILFFFFLDQGPLSAPCEQVRSRGGCDVDGGTLWHDGALQGPGNFEEQGKGKNERKRGRKEKTVFFFFSSTLNKKT